MSKGRPLSCYDYVNRPYTVVRRALVGDALGIFARATRAASARADAVGAELHVRVGALDVAAEIAIEIASVEDAIEYGEPATLLRLRWQSASRPGLFPVMDAALKIYALSATETQLELDGRYTPPLGPVGEALDSVAGHRIAQAAVHRFVQEVGALLRAELPV